MLVEVMGAFDEVYIKGAFDKVYMKPQRYGYGIRSWLRNMDMKDNVNVGKTLIYGYHSSFHFC
jgi:hypothetical protein